MSDNIWSVFNKLSGGEKGLKVGTVTAINGSKTTLEDNDGNSFTATGNNVAVSDKAFVKDGVIQGEAPSLTTSTVYV